VNPGLPDYSAGYLNSVHAFRKNLNISRTKRHKFVKQKAICGEGVRHCSGCLKNAVISLLRNGEHMFLKKVVNIPVLLLTLQSRLQQSECRTNEKMSYKSFLCGNLQNNFGPHKAPRHT